MPGAKPNPKIIRIFIPLIILAIFLLSLGIIFLPYKSFKQAPPKAKKVAKNLPLPKNSGCKNSKVYTTTEDALKEKDKPCILDLSSEGMSKPPSDLGGLLFLTSLDLSHNRLTEIPGDVTQMRYISYLDLSYNNIAAVNNVIGLNSLQTLNLSHNNISTLPAELTFVQSLSDLDISYNNLRSFPQNMKNLINLKRIIISGNKFKAEDKTYLRNALPGIQIVN